MKGVVTVDDIVDVVREEATEDMQKIGGTEALEGPYLQVELPRLFRARVPWLAALVVLEFGSVLTMSGFEETLEVREVAVEQLDEGMTLARDVTTSTGALLVSKGQEVTCALRRRLGNFARHGQIRDRVWVLIETRAARGTAEPAPTGQRTRTPT